MKHNLIKTENYLLVVDDSEIKEEDWAIHNYKDYRERFEEEPIKANKNNVFSIQEHWDKIIAHLPLNNASYLDGVPVLPSLNQEDEAEEIFPVGKHDVMHMPNREMINNALRQQAYNKAKEKYNLTWEKLIDLYIEETGYGMDMWGKEENKTMLTITKIIQSLQQPIPIAFECEVETIWVSNLDRNVPTKDDLIEVPKTIVNSEGRTEWVGKYIYE